MRLTKKADERKNQILDEALLLFITKGYSETTINDILQAVGIGKGTFYHYFTSKEEVLETSIIRFIDREVEDASQIARREDLNANDKISKILLQNASRTEKSLMIDVLHKPGNAQLNQKSLVETLKRIAPVLAEVIKQGISEGSYSTPYPLEAVEFLLSVSNFLFDTALFDYTHEEINKKAESFVYFAEKILGAEKGSLDYFLNILKGELT